MTAPLQIAFLTGQSDPGACALSPEQRGFLDALRAPGAGKLSLNFPYRDTGAGHRPVPLLRASLANARQYLASRRAAFARRHAPGVLRMLDGAERTLLLAGSCGLELLANLRLPAHALRRVHVLAYGPVARAVPPCSCLLVQGRGDWISRRWVARADALVDCDHLGYLRCGEVLALCQAMVDELLSGAGEGGCAAAST